MSTPSREALFDPPPPFSLTLDMGIWVVLHVLRLQQRDSRLPRQIECAKAPFPSLRSPAKIYESARQPVLPVHRRNKHILLLIQNHKTVKTNQKINFQS